MIENQNKAVKGSVALDTLGVKETMQNNKSTESIDFQICMTGTGSDAQIIASEEVKWHDAVECTPEEFLTDGKLPVQSPAPYVSTFFGQFKLQGKSKDNRNAKQSIFEFKRTGL